MEPMLRRVLILELQACATPRWPAGSARRSASTSASAARSSSRSRTSPTRRTGTAVIETLDSEMFRLLAEDPLRVHDAILALPRKVRDENPRFTLCLEVGWQPREGLAQAYLTIARRAAGIFAPPAARDVAVGSAARAADQDHRVPAEGRLRRRRSSRRTRSTTCSTATTTSPVDRSARSPRRTTSPGCRDCSAWTWSARARASRASFTLTQNRGEATDTLAERAAEATALVRALEGETDHASTWLALVAETLPRDRGPRRPRPHRDGAARAAGRPALARLARRSERPTTSCGRSRCTPPTATASTGATRSRPTARSTAPGPSTASSSSPDRPRRCC